MSVALEAALKTTLLPLQWDAMQIWRMVVDKCHYLPHQIWRGRWTNVIPSPADFGGGGRDKCLYLPRQLLVDGPTDLKSDF